MASALFNRGEINPAQGFLTDVEWFGTDVTVGVKATKVLRLIVQIGVSVSDAAVEVTFDSGVSWHALNSGTALTAGNLFTFDLYVRPDDQINFRAKAGTTILLLLTGDLDA